MPEAERQWDRAGPDSGQGEISTVVHPSQPFLETSMAEVIRLEDRLVRAPPKPSMGPIAPSKAVILLFTGIRYERLDGHPGNTPAKPAPSTAKKH
jgi:hypothetical protein